MMHQVLYNQSKLLVTQVEIPIKRNASPCFIIKATGQKVLQEILPIRNVLFLFSLLLFFLPQVRGQKIFIDDSIAMLPKSSYLSPNLKSIDPETINFKKYPHGRINVGYSGNEFHYFLVKLSSSKKLSNQYLSIENTSLDSIFIYSLFPRLPAKLYEGGRFIPYDRERNFVWHTAPVDISNKASYYLIAIKAAQKNIDFQFVLSDYSSLLNKYENFNRLVFFYSGIAFMISAIILLAFFLFKKPVFAIYAGYMFCVTFWIMDHYGMIYPNLYPHTPEINYLSKAWSSLGASFLLLTTQKLIFYSSLKSYPALTRMVNYLRYFIITLILLSFILLIPELNGSLEILYVVLWYSAILFSILIISFLPLHFIKTSEIARIFFLAMIVIGFTTLYQLLATIGILESNFFNEHAMALGSALENSIMAFGLLYGLMIERRNQNLQLISLQQEQKRILEKLVFAQANERKRIATDLHDNIGPLLAALKINFRRIINMNGENSRLELIEKTESIIDDSITEIRSVAHNLMPKNLESNGLIHSLEDYFRNVQQLYGKQLSFTHEVYSIFKPEIQANIYYIISELVLNAAKHSNAELINVSVKSEPRSIYIEVLDNGQGFPVKQIRDHHSFGIQSAESRTNYLKGNFSLKSSAGKGTVVNIKIPL